MISYPDEIVTNCAALLNIKSECVYGVRAFVFVITELHSCVSLKLKHDGDLDMLKIEHIYVSVMVITNMIF